MPKVFISYSWEDEKHRVWVRHMADALLTYGIEAVVDQYDLEPGDRLPQFMEEIGRADYVLIICTPTYKEKSDARKGGVGYESHIISGELLEKGNDRKFIPVIRKGNVKTAMPICLAGKLGVDLTDGPHYETNFNDLITTLLNLKKKPLSQKAQRMSNPELRVDEDGPIRILGIITDAVTVPRMDGTRGSALYKIPFKLSKRPSELWRQLFVREWDCPPRFTTMHRPGIASVYGDQIILDGTTIEEVRDYHRETLMLCVEEANKKEKEIFIETKRQEEQEKRRKEQHYGKVRDVANDIHFD